MQKDSITSIKSGHKLSDGYEIPYLGIGVWQIPVGELTENSVKWALESGYRHVDTAKIYRNETSVGKAVKDSKIKRNEIWITTKLWPLDITNAEKALRESLHRLDLDYVDLYLIHWPIPGLEKRSWKKMEDLVDKKLAKSIGVSNFSSNQVEKVLSTANIPPVLNQVRLSPFNYNPEFVNAHSNMNVAIEAYSPLTLGHRLNDPTLIDIAEKYKKSTAQLLIRWNLQKGFIVIPRSKNKEHIKENADVFDFNISPGDLKILDALGN